MNQSTNIEVCGNYHDNICGIGQEEIYSLDLWIFPMDNKIEEPIFTFESIVIQQVQGAHSGRCNQHLTESIEPFNELAVYYVQMAIKDLDLNQQHHPLLNACHSLASTLHLEQVTWHSIQLRLIQLIQRFPHILSGEKTGLDIFVDDDETGETFQHVKTLISATKTQQISHSICQYLQLQYERQTKDDNSFENYRLRIFWLTDIDLHYADSDPIQLANAQQTFNTHLTNQTKNLSIIYDETIDLYGSKTFDIIFSSNQLQENQDLINSLIDLRRLLELVHVPFYFDLTFGFNDQWWSSDADNHAQFNVDSNLNIIASPFIGLARSLITEYERHRLQLIDLQTSLNNNNQSIFIHTLIEFMINSRYSTDTCEVVLRLNHTNQNQVQHLTRHYEMLQNNNEQEKSKYEQISIIPKRDAVQNSFCICVPQSRFLFELTWIEENREKELLPSDMKHLIYLFNVNRVVEPTVSYKPSQIIEALLRCDSGQVMGKTVLRITSSDQPPNINKN
ncbi:unnamed protein product [Adineta steineri]|uniref:Uncharacterized protein n=1 Tax=Adineta steineri TaxID=433720 RepID=A0A818V5F8_9BILA|nr:unnamed protein product [Adineta steineri]